MSIILPGTLIVDGYISKTSYDSIPKEVKIISRLHKSNHISNTIVIHTCNYVTRGSVAGRSSSNAIRPNAVLDSE